MQRTRPGSSSSSSRDRGQREQTKRRPTPAHILPEGTHRLRAAPRVSFDASVVDNEDLGRRRSNICCIFPGHHHKQTHDNDNDDDNDDGIGEQCDPERNKYERG